MTLNFSDVPPQSICLFSQLQIYFLYLQANLSPGFASFLSFTCSQQMDSSLLCKYWKMQICLDSFQYLLDFTYQALLPAFARTMPVVASSLTELYFEL